MLVYEGTKESFNDSVINDTLAFEIENKILSKMGRHTNDNEFASWMNSMAYMYKVLNDEQIPDDAGIAIEYNIPQTAKRVDFMISGFDENDEPGVVVIELKQWSKLEKINDGACVKTYTGHALREVVHPSYQAWSYARLISDYNTYIQDNHVNIKPCAYLHNYIRKDNDDIDDKQYSLYTEVAPIFTMGQVLKLREYIKRFVKVGDNKQILYEIDHGKIKPSKSLQNSITSMLEGNEEFVMIDDQRVVFEKVLELSNMCQKDNQKRTIICTGGPGTGKSVISVQLLAELTKRDQFVQYVSKNMAPRLVYLDKLKGNRKLTGVENLFKGSQCYGDVANNTIDTLVVDEAHRLEFRNQYTKDNGNNNQIREIIHSSKCSVFFIDESQRVTTSDIGTVKEIERCANIEESQITYLNLVSQFRCNGSDGYLAWLDDVLEIRETANYNLDDIDYDFKIFDNPGDLMNIILEKNKESNKARMVAGYCWEWPKQHRTDSKYHDIKIGDFGISWNLDGTLFAIDENSVNEAGCIHTTQGLEFEYVGVIIGDDLRYEDGHIVTDFTKRAKTDQSIKGLKGRFKKEPQEALKVADEIIKNTYRTLMTRGMKGCYIYCTDKNLSDYFKKRILL